MVCRALTSLARRQLRGAAAVIALGPFMARVLAPRVADPRRLASVPLWGEGPAGPASPPWLKAASSAPSTSIWSSKRKLPVS